MTQIYTIEQCQAMALEIAKAASAYAESGAASFPEKPGMQLMYAEDRLALLHVAALFNKGLLAEAYEAAQNIDTAAREVIPDGPYAAMEAVVYGVD